MERDRGFNLKLLVPPRVSHGQVSAVPPQEIIDCGDFMNSLQQLSRKTFDKEQSTPVPKTSAIAPTKPTRQDFTKMKVVTPMEKDESNCNPGQLYSKLVHEVEKIKGWKVKVDSDTLQKERTLQENKRTIETQRKAIQELQFGNESLSVKLEEQISENEDLRNKNNATRNLCSLLKDTFQRSAANMHLFESEREETHHIFMENNESIQKLIAAFENLRIRVEADQQEMKKVKEGLLQSEELKERYHQELNIKEKEIAVLQTKLKDKEDELEKLELKFLESQKQCKEFQEATTEQYELLKDSKAEQESLLQKLHTAEQHCKETERNREAIASMLEQSKEEHARMIQSKDLNLQELSRVKNQQAEQLEQIQTTIQELQNSLALEIQRAKELEERVQANNKELELRNTLLGETVEQNAKKDEHIKVLEDELDDKVKCIESMKVNTDAAEIRVEELTAELSRKAEEAELSKNEAVAAFARNDLLKEACEAAEKAQSDLKEKSTVTEIKVQELERQLFTEIKKHKDHAFEMEQLRKDVTQYKEKYNKLLSNFNELHSERTDIQQQFESQSSNVEAIKADMKVSEDKVVKLTKELQTLEEENHCLRAEVNSVKMKIKGDYWETETLQKKIEENCDRLQEEITEKEKRIKAAETKLCDLRKKFEMKLKGHEKYQRENKMLKKQIAKEISKSSQLEVVISGLQEEFQNPRRVTEEDHLKLLGDLESKSTLAAELENEAQKLRLAAAEATKNKEDTELKCQHKIADMVALMEKHKNQYDRMVEEKDAELEEKKSKEMEAVAQKKSLELDLSKHKTEYDQLKQQLKTEVTQKENLQKELTDLKKEMSSMKTTPKSGTMNKQSSASNYKQGSCLETPKRSVSKRHIFDFSETWRTPSNSKDDGKTEVIKKAEVNSGELKTSRSSVNRLGGAVKIKSYRIRTPPSADKVARWGKSNIALEPKSDSSDQNDLLTFASGPHPSFSAAPHCKLHNLKKSPVTHKSPGSSLKLAAIKRMRDAGWTAVTSIDKKKKKKSNERIFA